MCISRCTYACVLGGYSVLMADVTGLTALSHDCSPAELIRMLNELFARFDQLAAVRVLLLYCRTEWCISRRFSLLHVLVADPGR